MLAVDPELLRLHPDAVLALVQGWQAVRLEETRRPGAMHQAMADSMGLQPGDRPGAWDGIRYPGPQEQYELLDPAQNNMPPLLKKIRQVLYDSGLIPAHFPLPTTTDSVIRLLAKAK